MCFNFSYRPYIEDSLKTVTALRPSGQWGYYGYPRCWDTNCNSSTISINDRLEQWESLIIYENIPPANLSLPTVNIGWGSISYLTFLQIIANFVTLQI